MWYFCVLIFIMRTVPSKVYGKDSKMAEEPKDNQDDVCSRYVDVAIVGAGPAGSYAAYGLRNENLTIEVLEYSNRVGGRLFTTVLPDAPDVNIELGGMGFFPSIHKRVVKALQDLGMAAMTSFDAPTDDIRYFLRGSNLGPDEIKSVYNLTEEERSAENLVEYLLYKLTGYKGSNLTFDELMFLKVPDGRYLYTVPVIEALRMVASDDAIALLQDSLPTKSTTSPDTSLDLWLALVSVNPSYTDNTVLTPIEGMAAIPRNLLKVFLKTSTRHRLTLNRRLMSISPRRHQHYKLTLRYTRTTEMGTVELEEVDVVCAKKVILAIPKFALSRLEWAPLRQRKFREAATALRPAPVLKVFLSFPSNWWRGNLTSHPSSFVFSDLPFHWFLNRGQSQVSGHYIMMACLADEHDARYLHGLNQKGPVLSGSPPGVHRVTQALADRLLSDLSRVFAVDKGTIPAPITSYSQYWNSYPFGGGWVLWRPGYRYDQVLPVIQRPGVTDDVFVVGADVAVGLFAGNVEGAMLTVEVLLNQYFP